MVAVPPSATKVVATVWLLPLMAAVTFAVPAVLLVRVTVTLPSAPVVPLAAMVAPLSALKLTVWFATGLPFASFTTAFTLLVAVPSAFALSLTTVRSPAVMVAVPPSAVRVTATGVTPNALPPTFAVIFVMPTLFPFNSAV